MGARLEYWGDAASHARAARPAPGDALTTHLRRVDVSSICNEDLTQTHFLAHCADGVWALGRVIFPHGSLAFQSAAGGAALNLDSLKDIYPLDFPPMGVQDRLHDEGDV